ncbi:MAG: Cof-type HAD-IIB family hydrolase [Lachnospiraceae bacterium]|nr:Cof-type HAD-IIB family hydrolase [Lachnospiraceae bacterium]
MKTDEIKILFSDLDGTLLTDDKSINKEDLQAIEDMISKGHKFVIATGRPLFSAVHIAKKYDWHREGFFISCYNGGMVYDCYRQELVVEYPLKLSEVKYVFDRAYEMGFHIHTYDDEYVVTEHRTREFEAYLKGINERGIVVKDIREHFKKDPIKFIVVNLESPKRLEHFQKALFPYTKGRMKHTFSNPILLEYSHPLASKGASIRLLAEHFKSPMENTIACGDEENDKSMIEAAGVGVLMANGNMKLKNVADYITEKDNNSGGIAEVIKKFVL